MDKSPSLGQPQREVHTVNGDSEAEFYRLKNHFEGSAVGIRNVMIQVCVLLLLLLLLLLLQGELSSRKIPMIIAR